MGTLPQKDLYKMYATYVSSAKAQFFKNLGLGAIQGEREGLSLKMLEGIRKKHAPLDLLDVRTSGGVYNLGHQHPLIRQALKDGIDAGLDIGDHHLISEQRALLARDLAHLLPGDISKTQFCVGGGEAVDLAIKLARASTQRTKIISALGGYHGVTGLAMFAGSARFRDAFLVHPKDFVHVEFGNLESLREVIDDKTAAVILETIPATGGILIAPPGYFQGVRDLCTELGVVLIADEVQTGLGRTGELWGIYGGIYPNEQIIPDIIVLAKGMSAGYYPLATVSYRPYLDEVFQKDPFVHISTTGGSELGCYVTRQMLGIVSKPPFLAHIQKMGKLMEVGLQDLKTQFPTLITEVRGRGLMWGVEFINDRYGIGYTLNMIQNGIWADYCGNNEKTIKLMPPLVVTELEIQEILKRLTEAAQKLPLSSEETGKKIEGQG